MSQPKILVVDDTPANLVAMRRLLARVDADVVEARSGNEALAACLDHQFALVLLDVNMPDMDGFEVAELLANEERTRQMPIIFVTAAYADDLNRLKGYGFGAVDYIAKPINDAILLSKVRVFLELERTRATLAAARDELAQRNRQLETEIAVRRRAEASAHHQATHDPLTGLPNRLLFIDGLEKAIARAQRHQRHFALGYIDIDGFKPVNDLHGHTVGDALLQAIALRLNEDLRREDTVARIGGDEFALIIEETRGDRGEILRRGEQLVERLRRPYVLALGGESLTIEIGASIGIAEYPTHALDRDGLIRAADEAMYRAKRGGRNRCVLAEPLAPGPLDRLDGGACELPARAIRLA